MDGMIKPRKLPVDTNQRAQHIAKLLTGELTGEQDQERSEVSIHFAEIGRKGGLRGGAARKQKLSAKRRKEIGKIAAQARWKSKTQQ
jgi:hypothetical protein